MVDSHGLVRAADVGGKRGLWVSIGRPVKIQPCVIVMWLRIKEMVVKFNRVNSGYQTKI